MNNKTFTIITVSIVVAMFCFAILWLWQNAQIQNAVIDGNELQAKQFMAIADKQQKIQKTLDERTPMIQKIEDNEDKILENQQIIHVLRERIEKLEKFKMDINPESD